MGKALYYTCAMMNRTLVKHVLDSEEEMPDVLIQGWVRTRRDSKAFSFLEVNDGSSVASLQVVADEGIPGYEWIGEMVTGSAVSIRGALVAGQGRQRWELRAASLELVGAVPDSYPLQKKGHTPEFLRSIAHLRPRTNLFGAVFRMRSRLAFAIHRFFQERDFSWVSTPIITASDCEGAGEMFRVTTLDVGDAASRDASRDFFGTFTAEEHGSWVATDLPSFWTNGKTVTFVGTLDMNNLSGSGTIELASIKSSQLGGNLNLDLSGLDITGNNQIQADVTQVTENDIIKVLINYETVPEPATATLSLLGLGGLLLRRKRQ